MSFLDKALSQLDEEVGGRDSDQPVPYYLETSLPNVNLAISGDQSLGFPGGRIITIAGPESCGKTALATELMVQAQAKGGFSFFEDFEHAFHHPHAQTLGLDTEGSWYYKKPASAEEGFGQVYKIMRTLRAAELGVTLPAITKKDPRGAQEALRKALRGVDLSTLMPICGVMDSIASMIPEEADVDYEDQNMKTKNMAMGMMLSTEMKRLARDADDTGSTIVMLNQLRTNPGVMFGDNSTEPGGNAPRFYASLQLRLRRVSKWFEEYGDKDTPIIGDVVEMFVRKNKIAPPFQKTKYVFRTKDPVGLDVVGTMIMLGKEAGILGAVSGKTVEFGGKKRWSIKDFDKACREDDDLKDKLVAHVMGSINPVEAGSDPESEEPKKTGAFCPGPL